MITNDTIGRNIRRLRKERNMTHLNLARKINLHRATLSAYELGKRLPDIFILISIADAFHVSLDVLVDRDFRPASPALSDSEKNIPKI